MAKINTFIPEPKEEYNIENNYRFNTYDEILNCGKIDSIYISTLNNTHADIIIKAAQAKKNILCEKPVTTNYSDTVKVFEELNTDLPLKKLEELKV